MRPASSAALLRAYLRGGIGNLATIGRSMRNAREQRLLRFGPVLLAIAVGCELKVLVEGAPVLSASSALLLTSTALVLVIARDALRRDR